MSIASRISKSRGYLFSQAAASALGNSLRTLPPYLLQDIGIEPHLVSKSVAQNTFFKTFGA